MLFIKFIHYLGSRTRGSSLKNWWKYEEQQWLWSLSATGGVTTLRASNSRCETKKVIKYIWELKQPAVLIWRPCATLALQDNMKMDYKWNCKSKKVFLQFSLVPATPKAQAALLRSVPHPRCSESLTKFQFLANKHLAVLSCPPGHPQGITSAHVVTSHVCVGHSALYHTFPSFHTHRVRAHHCPH